MSASRGARPEPDQQRLQPLADPEEEADRDDPDQERPGVRRGQVVGQRLDDLDQVVAAGGDAQDVLELARGDEDARRGDEPRDHRMAEEIGDEAEPEQAEADEEQAGEEGERDGGGGVVGGAGCGDLADRGCGHQRDDGDRPDRERSAGAEDGVGDERQDAGIEPDLGRQAGEHRIGQRLRDQHDRDDHGGHEIVGRGPGTVGAAPIENGKIAGEPVGGRCSPASSQPWSVTQGPRREVVSSGILAWPGSRGP